MHCQNTTNGVNNKTKTIEEKIRDGFRNITVEPVLILFILSTSMALLTTKNLNLEKACRVNLNYSQSICDALTARNTSGYNSSHEIAVQKLVATMNAWCNIIQSVIPAILLLYSGPWSDRHKQRKPIIIFPIVGHMLSSTCLIICTYFFYELSMEYSGLAQSLPPSLFGGWTVMFMATFSYVSGSTTMETKTFRIGTTVLLIQSSGLIGSALSGVMFKAFGFYGVFTTTLVCYTISITYGYFRIKDDERDEAEVIGKFGILADFFNTAHIATTFKGVLRKRQKNLRSKVFAILVLVVVIQGPAVGELNVHYLYTRYKFQWNEVDYSIFFTLHIVTTSLGTLFCLTFCSKFLKMDDAIVGVIAKIGKIVANIVYAFAPNPTVFYIGSLVDMFSGSSFIALRAIMSKLVPPEELGTFNSLIGLFETLVPLIYGPAYNLLYKATVNTMMPGAFLLVSAALIFPSIPIFLWLQYEQERVTVEQEKLNEETKEGLLQQKLEQPIWKKKLQTHDEAYADCSEEVNTELL